MCPLCGTTCDILRTVAKDDRTPTGHYSFAVHPATIRSEPLQPSALLPHHNTQARTHPVRIYASVHTQRQRPPSQASERATTRPFPSTARDHKQSSCCVGDTLRVTDPIPLLAGSGGPPCLNPPSPSESGDTLIGSYAPPVPLGVTAKLRRDGVTTPPRSTTPATGAGQALAPRLL